MIMMYADGGVCAVKTPYEPALIDEIKRLPSWARAWSRDRRVWHVAPMLAPYVAERLALMSGQSVQAPPADAYRPPEPVTVSALYVGKLKGEADWAAAHILDTTRNWSAALWGPAARKWFGLPERSSGVTTLYELIGVAPSASRDEIERAIKRALRQWHPDVCREPDAADRTRQILEARAVLLVDAQRAKYDKGLEVARLAGNAHARAIGEVRLPLRTGVIAGKGYRIADKTLIVEIADWSDLTDQRGRVAVVSWPYGVDDPLIEWV